MQKTHLPSVYDVGTKRLGIRRMKAWSTDYGQEK